jgi:hypothetical protein
VLTEIENYPIGSESERKKSIKLKLNNQADDERARTQRAERENEYLI